MALESVTHITDLVASNPVTGDPVSQGDDHLKNIKTALLNDFASISGPVTATHTELNYLDGVTAGTAVASKALIVDANKDIALGTGDLSATDITASGTITGALTGNVTGNVTGDLTGNVTATSVLADGVTCTTQSAGDNSTKTASTAYADAAAAAVAILQSTSRAANGYLEFETGSGVGVAVQWGTDAISGSVTFPKAFSATAYSVVFTPLGSGSALADSILLTMSSTGFTYNYAGSGGISAIYWVAFGPTTF